MLNYKFCIVLKYNVLCMCSKVIITRGFLVIDL